MPVGTFASAVHIAASTCTDVLSEPFNNLTAWTLTGTPTLVAGRTGTAVSLAGATNAVTYTIPSASESTYLTVGFAFRLTSISSQRVLMTLLSDAGATIHNHIDVDALGRLVVYRGSGTTASIAISATGAVAINTWYYFELQALLSDTAPQTWLTGRLNGVQVFTGTTNPVDTKNAGTKTTYDTIRLGVGGSSNTLLIDDLYISTGSGCTFKGDQTIPPCTDVLTEPFDNFTTAPWTLTSTPTIVSGRTGTACQCSTNAPIATYDIAAPNASRYITVGFAWRYNDALGTQRGFLNLYSQTASQSQMRLRYTPSSGALVLQRGATQIGSTATFALAQNVWAYFEVQAYLADTGGSATVRVNGTPVITFSGDTRNGGDDTYLLDRVRCCNDQAGSFIGQWDDLYVSTGSGCAFKGDITIP